MAKATGNHHIGRPSKRRAMSATAAGGNSRGATFVFPVLSDVLSSFWCEVYIGSNWVHKTVVHFQLSGGMVARTKH